MTRESEQSCTFSNVCFLELGYSRYFGVKDIWSMLHTIPLVGDPPFDSTLKDL